MTIAQALGLLKLGLEPVPPAPPDSNDDSVTRELLAAIAGERNGVQDAHELVSAAEQLA